MQELLSLQFHPTCLFLSLRICLLWLDIIDFIFVVLLFMMLLLNIFEKGFHLGKFFFSILKNSFPTWAFTLKEKGGLNHIIFLLLFLFSLFLVCPLLSFLLYFSSSLKPLLLSACSYELFPASKISWLHEISVIHLLIALGSSFKIFGGWFECLLM